MTVGTLRLFLFACPSQLFSQTRAGVKSQAVSPISRESRHRHDRTTRGLLGRSTIFSVPTRESFRSSKHRLVPNVHDTILFLFILLTLPPSKITRHPSRHRPRNIAIQVVPSEAS
jgi:hypothetical protein